MEREKVVLFIIIVVKPRIIEEENRQRESRLESSNARVFFVGPFISTGTKNVSIENTSRRAVKPTTGVQATCTTTAGLLISTPQLGLVLFRGGSGIDCSLTTPCVHAECLSSARENEFARGSLQFGGE